MNFKDGSNPPPRLPRNIVLEVRVARLSSSDVVEINLPLSLTFSLQHATFSYVYTSAP